jgi:hypothetical protein
MSTWVPEPWTFSEDTFKPYECDSSSTSSSDDEPIFSKTKTLKKTKYKKIEKEPLLPE